MSTCEECEKPVKPAEKLVCCDCNSPYHFLCANLTATNFKKMAKANWTCAKCTQEPQKENTPSRGSRSNDMVDLINNSEDSKSLLTEIRLLRKDMANLKSEFTSRFEALSEKLLDYDMRILKLEEKEKENALLKSQVADLQKQLNQQAQYALNSELEIIGLSETANENPYHMVLTTASKLGMKLEEEDVNFASRAGPLRRSGNGGGGNSNGDALPRPLVVSFVRRAKREEFLKNAKSRRSSLNSTDIVPAVPEKKIFVNERLTYDSRQLFRDARAWAREQGFKYCWTRGGNIYVRKHEGQDGSPAVQIRSHEDLHKLSGKRD